MTPLAAPEQSKRSRCVLTMHDVRSIKDLIFVVGGNSESGAQKAAFEILDNNIRDARSHDTHPRRQPHPQQHCEHEGWCWHQILGCKPLEDGKPKCVREGCEGDTRTTPHPPPPPAPSQPARLACIIDLHAYQHGNTLFEDIRACSGVSCNYCGRYTETEHDAQIAKAAREQVLDAVEEFLNNDDHLSLYKWEVREQLRSLRQQE